MSCRKNGGKALVVGSRWSVVGARLAFASVSMLTAIDLVVGSRWSVVGARWAFESAGMHTATTDRSFDFAQDDGWRE